MNMIFLYIIVRSLLIIIKHIFRYLKLRKIIKILCIFIFFKTSYITTTYVCTTADYYYYEKSVTPILLII